MTNTETRSRVAMLGTLAELHQKPIQYDLRALRRLVKDLQPDLLCAEIHPGDWQAGELSSLPPEYREALVPLSRRTNIIIVPVSGSRTGSSSFPAEPLVGSRPGRPTVEWPVVFVGAWRGGEERQLRTLRMDVRLRVRFTAWPGPAVLDQANQAIVNNVLPPSGVIPGGGCCDGGLPPPAPVGAGAAPLRKWNWSITATFDLCSQVAPGMQVPGRTFVLLILADITITVEKTAWTRK
jgi:hypothetical protein